MKLLLALVFIQITLLPIVYSENKYSKTANVPDENPDLSVKQLEKPFRMAKLNMLWVKAVARLPESKLKSLFSELKIHDKEEITWKRLKSEGKDKEGLKEAELRKKLIGIMSTYGLLEHFDHITSKQNKAFNEASEEYLNKSMFKDKKLNALWSKAENAGFTIEELKALREEFYHHQEKIEQYYALLDDVNRGKQDDHLNTLDDKHDKFNAIETDEENEIPQKDYLAAANLVREKHSELRDGYDRLHRLAAKGPRSKEFVEPKVQGLWKMAVSANFTNDELESLRIELQHYEKRLLKLRQLQIEAAIGDVNNIVKKPKFTGKNDGEELMQDTIKKQTRKVQTMHEALENRILSKHIEL